MEEKSNIVWKEKFALPINEAAEYFSIGTNKLREMVKEPECDFVLYVGKKALIKRERLEKYLDKIVYL
nr:excisionase [uncultured Blautia sp.]